MKKLSLFLIGSLLPAILAAAEPLTGEWQTIDDASGKPKGVITITRKGDSYVGVIKEVLPAAKTKICDKCAGKDKNRPLAGLTVLTGLKKTTTDKYENGKIFDPGSGNTYAAAAVLINGGKQLQIRGYLGIKLLGRTQTWNKLK